MAGNLGFDAHLVCDAIWVFGQAGVDGEFATITDTKTVIAQVK